MKHFQYGRAAFSALLLLLAACAPQTSVETNVQPTLFSITAPGEVGGELLLQGRYFGDGEGGGNDSYVLLGADISGENGGRIRAALDVTDPEPLPEDHPLWSLPGVLIAPHVGGATSAMRPRVARLIARQIERMQRGEDPLNVVFGG